MAGSRPSTMLLGLGPSFTIFLFLVFLSSLLLHYQKSPLHVSTFLRRCLYPSPSANPPTAFSIRLKSPGSYFHWWSWDLINSPLNEMPWLVMPGSHVHYQSQESGSARMAWSEWEKGRSLRDNGVPCKEKENEECWWGKNHHNKDTKTHSLQDFRVS